MTDGQEGFQALRRIYPSAEKRLEAGCHYLYIPRTRINSDGKVEEVDTLLSYSTEPTKLYLGRHFHGKAKNWNTCVIMGQEWHTFSYSGVGSGLPLLDILANHLRALR